MKNELLKEALMRAKKTIDEIAQEVGVDPKTVSRWLNGRVVPHARHRWAIAQLLQMKEEDLWDLPELSKPPSLEIVMPHEHHPQSPVSALPIAQESSLTYNNMSRSSLLLPELDILMKSRRQVLKEILSTASAAFVLSPSALLPQHTNLVTAHSSYIDAEALDDLAAITKHYWKLSENVSIDLLSGVAGHFTTVTQLLNTSHPTPVYEKLCLLASENALLMGNTFRDIREYDLAWEYYKFSLKVAREAQNGHLWATGAGSIALLLICWGQPQQALPLLQEAQRQELRNPRLCAWLSSIEAEIHAKAGNADGCMRCLDTSKSVTLPDSLMDDTYHTGFHSSRAIGYESSCFMLLHQSERALPTLNEALTLCDSASLRHKSTLLADIGTVHAQLGDVQSACSFILQALEITEQTKSLFVLHRIYKGRKELDHWKDGSEVKALDERIVNTLMTLTRLKEQVH